MAERMGFEPMVSVLPRHAISSRAYSSTLAPLRTTHEGSRHGLACGHGTVEPEPRCIGETQRGGPGEGHGESGIRTHDEIAPILVFETSALNRSAISPHTAIIA